MAILPKGRNRQSVIRKIIQQKNSCISFAYTALDRKQDEKIGVHVFRRKIVQKLYSILTQVAISFPCSTDTPATYFGKQKRAVLSQNTLKVQRPAAAKQKLGD